jgi:hypothetical protein
MLMYFADETLFQLKDSLNKQIKKYWSADGQSLLRGVVLHEVKRAVSANRITEPNMFPYIIN